MGVRDVVGVCLCGYLYKCVGEDVLVWLSAITLRSSGRKIKLLTFESRRINRFDSLSNLE